MDLWLQVVSEVTALTEEVRKGDPEKTLVPRTVKMFAWICAFVGKYIHSQRLANPIDQPLARSLRSHNETSSVNRSQCFTRWILNKYAYVCPVCGWNPCLCPAFRLVTERRHKISEEHQPREYKVLTEFGAIYRELMRERVIENEQETEEFCQKSLDELIDFFTRPLIPGQVRLVPEDIQTTENQETIRKHLITLIATYAHLGEEQAEKKIANSGRLKELFEKLSLEFIKEAPFTHGIYAFAHYDIDLWKILAHLLEEIGEVTDEILRFSELNSYEEKRIKGAYGDEQGKSRPPFPPYTQILEEAAARLVIKQGSPTRQDLEKLKTDEECYEYAIKVTVNNLRGELTDVFSWLAALLRKVGDIWRALEGEEQEYRMADFIVKHLTQNGDIICPACRCIECEGPQCYVRHITKKILVEQQKKKTSR